ncbi:hypothetical protein WKR98_23195 [Pigmentiphaga sp. YJ18]|uniref:hypothetical protein n=1 Tax=Pigmentiphaga sp. YJ18 TaxID=3134907 RepID=UPI003115700C
MSFADWIESQSELGADPAEIDAAIGAEQRLKAATIIAREVLTNPSEDAVLAVFADVCASAALGTTIHPRQRPTLH